MPPPRTCACYRYALWLCDELDAHAAELSLVTVECFTRELRAWRLARRESFPVPAERFNGVAREFLGRQSARLVNSQLGYVLDGDVLNLRFSHVRAVTNVHYAAKFSEQTDLKQR